jgi:DNA (cytosine-5)-methyltransferase 1
MTRAAGNNYVWDPSVPVEQNAYYWTKDPVVQRPKNSSPDVDSCAPTVIELFCGLGGFSQGFVQAGFRVVLGGDIHKPSIASYSNNHPDAVTILGDLRKVSGSMLRSVIHTDINVVLAGVPCQGFSLSNRKRHDGDNRNQLFRDAIRLAKALQPRAMVIENVLGMRSAGRGSFVNAVREEIEGCLGLRCHVVLLDALTPLHA